MFKFVHIADVHLDSLVLGYESHRQSILDAVFNSFEKSVDIAIENNCHALIMSGDLFDSERMSFNTELRLRDNFKKLNNHHITVLYCLGNHDPATSRVRLSKLGENVLVFDTEIPRAENITDNSGKLVGIVSGVGYEQKHVNTNLAKKFAPIKSDVPVVGMLHTSLDMGGDNSYSPCKLEDLDAIGYDYWALGHIHEGQINQMTSSTIAYPGCISGTHWNETGEKGCLLVEVAKNQAAKCTPICLSDIMWHKIDVSGFHEAQFAQDIVDIAVDTLYDLSQNTKKNFVRMTFTGPCKIAGEITDESIMEFEARIEDATNCFVSIKNHLTSAINPDDYKNDKHLLSIAMQYANDINTNPEKLEKIMTALKNEYRTLDGGTDNEYILSLLKDIDKNLCEAMLNLDKAGN